MSLFQLSLPPKQTTESTSPIDDDYEQHEPIKESELNNKGCEYNVCPDPQFCKRGFHCSRCAPYDLRDVCHDHLDRNGRYQECYCYSCHCPPDLSDHQPSICSNDDKRNGHPIIGVNVPRCQIVGCERDCWFNHKTRQYSRACGKTHARLLGIYGPKTLNV